MVNRKFEERIAIWSRFRQTLETAKDPITETINFWNDIPTSSRNLDPFDMETWPEPWEMIEENTYCEFGKLLAIAYTLKLTEKFKDWQPVFKIGLDRRTAMRYYMLILNDQVIGFDQEKSIDIISVPQNIQIEKIHVLKERY